MDGIRLRDEIVAGLRATIEAAGSPPVCLATVLVGDDRPSHSYVRMKHERAALAGMVSRNETLPATATQAEVEALVQTLVDDPGVHGILVQLPLPAGLDEDAVHRADPGGQGRRRADGRLARPPGPRRAGPRRLHADRGDAPARALRRGHVRRAGRRDRPLDTRRPAAVAAAGPQGHRCDGDHRPQPHARSRRAVPRGRHRRRRRRSGRDDHGRARQARAPR